MTLLTPDRDLRKLAPKFGLAVAQALNECRHKGIDVVVQEALRSDELQRLYYERGTTNAKSALYSWHGYGLAVDLISASRLWNVWPERTQSGGYRGGDARWYQTVIAACKSVGLDWGGDWRGLFDAPHFQWGTLKANPSDYGRQLYQEGGLEAVWREVGAV